MFCFQEEVFGGNNDDENKLKCEACDEILPDKQRLEFHMEGHRLSFCDRCQMMIEPRQWRTHPCNNATLFSCEKCDYTSVKKSNLTRHKQRKHSEKFQCEKCSRTFRSIEKLHQHVEAVHSSCFKCEICDQQFGSLSSKKRHTKAAHLQQDSAVVNMNIDTVETSSFTSQGTQDSELTVPMQVRRSSQSRSISEPQSSSYIPSDSRASSDNDEASNSGVAVLKNQQKNLISLEQHSQRPEARLDSHGEQISGHHSLSDNAETVNLAKSLLDFGYKFNSEGRLKKLPMTHLFIQSL